MIHRGAYWASHIVDHEDTALDFHKENPHNPVVTYMDNSDEHRHNTTVFSEEDVDFVSQQEGWTEKRQDKRLLKLMGTGKGNTTFDYWMKCSVHKEFEI